MQSSRNDGNKKPHAEEWKQILASYSIIACSPSMKTLFDRIDMVASSNATVLLVGETGVGKELVAEYIHRSSPRAQKSFVKVGLATLPPELLESELFGHEAGAFTHAVSGKKGLFELAHTGTILLDDIDDFPRHCQVKLLRVLEEREIMHIGGIKPIPIDTRVICATKVDLKQLVDRGMFRSDLYYRINVMPIVIPPLRERQEDISLLLEHFLKRYSAESALKISPAAIEILQRYTWPGNVRELRNVAQRLALLCKRTVDVGDLPRDICSESSVHNMLRNCAHCFTNGDISLEELLSCLEYNLLMRALHEAGGNRAQAARALHMKLSTFRDRLQKFGIRIDASSDSN